MHPYFQVFSFHIPAYGVMTALAAVAAFFLLWLQARKTALWPDMFNYYFIAIVGVLAGSMFLYGIVTLPSIITQWETLMAGLSFGAAVERLVQLLGGFVFYGGLLGGVAAMGIYARVFKTPLLPYTDLLAPVVPIAHGIGRIGCFLGGCCFGVPVASTHPLAVVYPPESLSAPSGEPMLALPLVEAAVNIVIAMLLYCLKKNKGFKTGTLTAAYLIMYGAARFVLEMYRGDMLRGVYRGVSTSQLISAVVLLAGILLFYKKYDRSGSREA